MIIIAGKILSKIFIDAEVFALILNKENMVLMFAL